VKLKKRLLTEKSQQASVSLEKQLADELRGNVHILQITAVIYFWGIFGAGGVL
jgi:hypothetical protein